MERVEIPAVPASLRGLRFPRIIEGQETETYTARMTDLYLFVELFPIQAIAIPPLVAYALDFADNPPEPVGGRLAYRLSRTFPGRWVWAEEHILTDTPLDPVEIVEALDYFRERQPDVYGRLHGLMEDTGWQVTAGAEAEYAARTLMRDLDGEMQQALGGIEMRVRNVRVERETHLQAWVAEGQPALSFSIPSRLVYSHDLGAYARTLDSPGGLVGLLVAGKTGSLVGEVLAVSGPLEEARERLLAQTRRKALREIIQSAPDADPVVKVRNGRDEELPASALNIIIRSDSADDIRRFKLNPQQVQKATRLTPEFRSKLVKAASDVVKQAGLIDNAYNSRDFPAMFRQVADDIDLCFASNRVRPYAAETLAQDFISGGVYKQRAAFKDGSIRIATINTLDIPLDDYIEALKRQIERDFGFSIELIRERRVKQVSRKNIQSAVKVVEADNPHIALAFLPDVVESDEEKAAFAAIKAQTLEKGIASHIIRRATVDQPEAMADTILAILGKTGNVPFVLAEPLDYADYVAGLEVVRDEGADGTRVTAIARIYQNSGELLRYSVRTVRLEGETLPYVLMRDLFPQREFKGKRVILHHAGRFSENEAQALAVWGQAIKAAFYPVEIGQQAAPRLYAGKGRRIQQPPWGSAFILSEAEAFLVTALPPDEATPQPLHIRTGPPLTIQQAMRSVLLWTVLHYGQASPPRLPVTVQHSDELVEWLGRGGLPEATEGDVPFWL